MIGEGEGVGVAPSVGVEMSELVDEPAAGPSFILAGLKGAAVPEIAVVPDREVPESTAAGEAEGEALAAASAAALIAAAWMALCWLDCLA